MKLFLDTEFTGLHQRAKLISIGIVTEDENKFYAEFNDYSDDDYTDAESLNWCKENVEKNLLFNKNDEILPKSMPQYSNNYILKSNTSRIRESLDLWVRKYPKVEFWSDCLSYDWVLLNSLFRNKLPHNVYYIPFDISTQMKLKGIDPDISRQEFSGVKGNQHNSLTDALMIKKCYERLERMGKNDK